MRNNIFRDTPDMHSLWHILYINLKKDDLVHLRFSARDVREALPGLRQPSSPQGTCTISLDDLQRLVLSYPKSSLGRYFFNSLPFNCLVYRMIPYKGIRHVK